MRSGGETCHAHVANGAADGNPGAGVDALCKTSHVPVTTDETVTVANVDGVAVTALAAGEDDDPVADRPHRSAHCRRVVCALVLPPDAEHGMPPSAKDA